MTVKELIEKMELTPLNVADAGREVLGAYCGDFLSFAIAKAREGFLWLTIMNNVNVAGVASLTDVAIIVLCDNVPAEDNLLNKCKMQGINLAVSKIDVYNSAIAFNKIFG